MRNADSTLGRQASGVRLRKDVPFSAENGAAAPLRTNDVIRKYAEVAARVGRPDGFDDIETWRAAKDALGGQVKRLINREGWSPELVMKAVENYARRRRNPYFVAEWIRLEYADEREAEHVARKEAEPRDGGLRSLAKAMREVGL